MCAVAAVRNDKKRSHLHDGSEIPLGRIIVWLATGGVRGICYSTHPTL